jgi:hypothetical protein
MILSARGSRPVVSVSTTTNCGRRRGMVRG